MHYYHYAVTSEEVTLSVQATPLPFISTGPRGLTTYVDVQKLTFFRKHNTNTQTDTLPPHPPCGTVVLPECRGK